MAFDEQGCYATSVVLGPQRGEQLGSLTINLNRRILNTFKLALIIKHSAYARVSLKRPGRAACD